MSIVVYQSVDISIGLSSRITRTKRLLSFDTESAWSACDLFFDELNKVLGNELSISYREIECGCEIFYVHDVGGFFPEECCVSRDSITKCKIFVLNSHHIFDARDLMADWGWGFTNPQPLPNPILSRAKGNFQLAIQKKETEVSLRLTNFVLHMYKQLTSEQRSQIFVLLQKENQEKINRPSCRVQSVNAQP